MEGMYSERNYEGWDSVVLTSGQAEIVIPKGIGPRVMYCGFKGGANLFHNVKEDLGKSGEPDWHVRGGHRLWHAPELMPRTYDPDNFPIVVEKSACGKAVIFTPSQPDPAGMLKSIRIEPIGGESFKLIHRIENHGQWPVRMAPWAITVMERGGYATLPTPPKGVHPIDLLPTYKIIPWAYTDLSLPQWEFKRDYIGVDSAKTFEPQKIGLSDYAGWIAYWQPGGTFVKAASVVPGGDYPDFGSSAEIFSNEAIIELETLAPFSDVQPGEAREHVEYWGVLKDLPKPQDEAAFNGAYRKAIEAWHTTYGKAK